MDEQQRDAIEQGIRRSFDAGDLHAAAEAALRGYGRELFAFLAALHRDAADAGEVFSLFLEGLWRGLPNFGWQSSFRTWAYGIARRTSLRYQRDARRRAVRFSPWSEGTNLSRIEAQIRTETQAALRTAQRSRIAALRDALPPEDQQLLMLRVDRQLAWNDLVEVLREEGEPLTGEALKREAARLRKRFQTIKERLHDLARREGLLKPPD